MFFNSLLNIGLIFFWNQFYQFIFNWTSNQFFDRNDTNKKKYFQIFPSSFEIIPQSWIDSLKNEENGQNNEKNENISFIEKERKKQKLLHEIYMEKIIKEMKILQDITNNIVHFLCSIITIFLFNCGYTYSQWTREILISFYCFDTMRIVFTDLNKKNYGYIIHHIIGIIPLYFTTIESPHFIHLIKLLNYLQMSNIFLYLHYHLLKIKIQNPWIFISLSLQWITYFYFRIYSFFLYSYQNQFLIQYNYVQGAYFMYFCMAGLYLLSSFWFISLSKQFLKSFFIKNLILKKKL